MHKKSREHANVLSPQSLQKRPSPFFLALIDRGHHSSAFPTKTRIFPKVQELRFPVGRKSQFFEGDFFRSQRGGALVIRRASHPSPRRFNQPSGHGPRYKSIVHLSIIEEEGGSSPGGGNIFPRGHAIRLSRANKRYLPTFSRLLARYVINEGSELFGEWGGEKKELKAALQANDKCKETGGRFVHATGPVYIRFAPSPQRLGLKKRRLYSMIRAARVPVLILRSLPRLQIIIFPHSSPALSNKIIICSYQRVLFYFFFRLQS